MPREWSVQRPWDGRAAVNASVLAVPDAPGSPWHASARQKSVLHPRSTRKRHAPSPLGRRDVQHSSEHSPGHDGVVQQRAGALSPLPPSSCTRSHARQHAAHLKPAATPAADCWGSGVAGQSQGPALRTALHRRQSAAGEAVVRDRRHAAAGQRGSCTSGSVAASAVEPEVLELLRAAVRRLRGLRLCEDGNEEARLTHLVLGEQRRTLKVRLEPLAGPVLCSRTLLRAAHLCAGSMSESTRVFT